jgi:hypothetical protein
MTTDMSRNAYIELLGMTGKDKVTGFRGGSSPR